MRIISGKYKSRVIAMPKSIRPTQNKVRKALFDILGDIHGLSFLELFSGSGAVGLEALSMGAGTVVFVENDSECVRMIRQNLLSLTGREVSSTGPAGECGIIGKEAQAAIKDLHKERRLFDIIYIDPPYYKAASTPEPKGGFGVPLSASTPEPKGGFGVPLSAAKKTLQTLFECDILAANGLIIVQHFKKDDLPDTLGVLSLFRQSRYGRTLLSFYHKK